MDFSTIGLKEVKTLLLDTSVHWTVQGFGMMRAYLDGDRIRVNIWHEVIRKQTASFMHNHPWHFTSRVLQGRILNTRYVQHKAGTLYHCKEIRPGKELLDYQMLPDERLLALPLEIWYAGTAYTQQAHEVHETAFSNGTITINERKRVGADLAKTYWLPGTDWGSAEPRDATGEEISYLLGYALGLMAREGKL
jgi:hypothetical protein